MLIVLKLYLTSNTMLPFTLTKLEKHSMYKYGWGREEEGVRRRRVKCMDPRKSTCMLLSLSLLDTLDTYTCRLLHEFYGVVVCRLKNMCHTV